MKKNQRLHLLFAGVSWLVFFTGAVGIFDYMRLEKITGLYYNSALLWWLMVLVTGTAFLFSVAYTAAILCKKLGRRKLIRLPVAILLAFAIVLANRYLPYRYANFDAYRQSQVVTVSGKRIIGFTR